MAGRPATGWRPTATLIRGAVAGPVMAVTAVLLGRPVLLGLAAPWLRAALAGLLARPRRDPVVDTTTGERVLPEGGGTMVRATVSGDELEQVTRVLAPVELVASQPVAGAVSSSSVDRGDVVEVGVAVSPRRWGRPEVGVGLLAATSTWGGYVWGPVPTPARRLTVLPAPLPFDTRAETPRPVGLVGANRSRRNGEGTEFSGIRPFQAGDRLRRIHWRTSLRTGQLHTITTTAEQESEVVLLVDALADVGASRGVDGSASSLDTTVRAAAALAEHHLRIGNRVGLRVLGGAGHVLRPSAGMRHQRRILETLAAIVPDPVQPAGRLRLGVGAGTTVLVLSPLLARVVTTTLVELANRGLPVVAIDTLPTVRPDDASRQALAWRLRLVERQLELVELARVGIPVVTWRGPGTLDEVMRRLARRAQLPRVVSR
jgi:uncharacterized protein (DUF58 family)